METKNLNAGREIDALVAEKVFGHEHVDRLYERCYRVLSPEESRRSGAYSVMIPIPHYSTDIAAAWEVVAALHDRSMKIEYDESDGEVRVSFFGQADSEHSFHEEKGGLKYLPHAICMAALKSVGVDV